MSSNQDLQAAYQAEKDLNSYAAKAGKTGSDTAAESGIDSSVEHKFAERGASVTYGSAASGAGDNREIPVEGGGDILKNGRPTKARDFEGPGGPEDKVELDRQNRGGYDDVDSIVR